MPGVGATGLPLTAVMISPTWKPALAPGDCGSTAVMAPSLLPVVPMVRPEYPTWLLARKPACSKSVTHFLTTGAAIGPTPIQGAVAPSGFTSSVLICPKPCAAAQANASTARKHPRVLAKTTSRSRRTLWTYPARAGGSTEWGSPVALLHGTHFDCKAQQKNWHIWDVAMTG